MSWFDSKKLQTYAKSTLLQAQKQIDKVLDIKEEEFLNNEPKPAVASESSQSSDSIADNFFSTFLNQTDQKPDKPLAKKSSISKNLTSISSSNIDFEEFLNQDSKSIDSNNQLEVNVPKHSQPKTSQDNSCLTSSYSPSASQTSDQFSTTPSISFVENASEQESDQTETDEKLNKKKSPSDNRSQSKKSERSKNRSKVSEATGKTKHQNSKIELEKIEKQNWVNIIKKFKSQQPYF